jgi:hypothetical protein
MSRGEGREPQSLMSGATGSQPRATSVDELGRPGSVGIPSRWQGMLCNRLRARLMAYHAGEISYGELDASIPGWINHVGNADGHVPGGGVARR